ncbi:MAG: M23 family metallopeptidase [Candidatus Zixiibacteriota bacterium]
MRIVQSKYVTVMLVPDGTEARLNWRVRWLYVQIGAAALILIVIGIVLFFIFYGQMATKAALAERLKAENEDLQRYRFKVKLLEDNLVQVRDMVTRLTKLAGIDYQFPDIPDDSTLFAQMEQGAPAILPRMSGTDDDWPSGLPLQGFLSRGFQIEDSSQYHPGLDIACAIGTPVLATGAGQVTFAGVDSVYGNMVVIKNNDSVMTVFGHNERLLVRLGQKVQVGSRIALSGNSGRSSAPHLHYELRIHNQPINPLEDQYDQETLQ